MKTYEGMINFIPWLLYPLNPFNRRLDGSQNWSGLCREEKDLAPTRTETPTPQPSSL
jgi:hypothetical protein